MVEGMPVVVNVMLSLMSVMSPTQGTKRIQPARGWCATVKRNCEKKNENLTAHQRIF